jgi:SNF2 family DNA or RNA helicase
MHKAKLWVLDRPPFRAQIEAIEAGWDKPGFNFFMEQGLGKSATALNNYELLRRAGKVKRLLILSPNSFKSGWEDEVKKAGISVPVAVYRPDRAKAFLKTVTEEDEWIAILNYESLAKMAETHGEKLSGPWTMIVADESIKLKNPRSQTAKAALWLAARCGWQRTLSGKPVTQGPQDLWAQLKFMGFIKRMNYYAFRNNFCVMGGWQGKQVVGAQNQDELNRVLKSCSFLARKKDFTDLPEKLPPITIPVEMRGAQEKLYRQMEKEFLADIRAAGEEGSKITVDQIITRDIKLRQIMSGWIYDEDKNVEVIVPFEQNPRFQVMKDILEDTISGKAIIVAWYKPTIEALIRALGPDKTAWIRGGMTPEEIVEQKRRFNEEDDVLYMVVQEVAAKYGHTLLGTEAQPCSTMFFFEQSYSLDDRSQIEDRMHRYGQKWPCSYYDFVAGKLDRACVRALQRKESVAAAILGYAKGEFVEDLQGMAVNDALAMAGMR